MLLRSIFRSRARGRASTLGVVGSLALLAGCSAPDPVRTEVGGHLEPIVGGQTAPDEDNVVLIYLNGGQFSGTCTGAIISSRVVLTAKHCVQLADATGPMDPGELYVGIGPVLSRDMTFLPAVDVVTTPGSFGDDSLSITTDLVGVDVAVITLRDPIDIPPLPIKLTSPEEDKGKPGVAIGYGQTPSGGSGTKMRVDTTVDDVLDRTIEVHGTICQGDSGGPLINHEGKIIGVVSVGTAGSCGPATPAYYNRIDIYADMIMQAIEKSGDCSGDGVEQCDGFDNDCDDLVDEDCLDDGVACEESSQCLSRLCADTRDGRVCTSKCDPLAPAVCAEGFVCQATTDCQGLCVKGNLGSKTFGEACETADECESLFCADPGDGKKRCLEVCRGGEGSCLSGEACVARDGACGSCIDADKISSPLGQDEPCEENADCRSNNCFDDGGLKYCVESCTTDSACGDDHHCRDNVCIRGTRGSVGSPCVETNDCDKGQFCAKNDMGRFCTATCESAADCVEGFSCKEVNNGKACLPDLGVIGGDCAKDEDCLSGFCFVEGKVCTRACDSSASCGAGLECVRSELGDPGLCLGPDAIDLAPPEEPGKDGSAGDGSDGSAGGGSKESDDCSLHVGTSSASSAFGLMMLGLAFSIRRRRR